MEAIGERVKLERERIGIAQEELARRTRLSVKTVSNLERGRHTPRVETLMVLAKALGVPLPRLLPEWLLPAA